MFDPEFDPYDELMAHRHNIQEIAKGINHQSQYLKELALQHEQLARLIKHQADRIYKLEIELAALKSTRD